MNPAKLHKVKETGDQYWITDDSDIRPYGIIVKEIHEPEPEPGPEQGCCRIL